MLTVKNIRASHSGQTVLRDVSFECSQGTITGFTGPSGSGKTTLMRVIAGLHGQDRGTVYWGEQLLSSKPPQKRPIGYMFQNLAVFPHLTVAENISFGLRGYSRKERIGKIFEMLELTDLRGIEKRYPHQLSGGQQQRVALARAIAPSPEILLMDEPFSSLDESIKSKVQNEIIEIVRSIGLTTLLVTHHAMDACAIADQIVVMENGTVIQSGIPKEIYEKPSSEFVSAFFGSSILIESVYCQGVVSTEFGNFKKEYPIQEGQYKLFIRPEYVSLVNENQQFHLTGKVSFKKFRGPHEIIGIINGDSLVSFETEKSSLQPGTDVYLKLDLQRVRFLKS